MTSAAALERTHCKKGHRLTEANTYFKKQHINGNIVARCRKCKRDRDNAATERRKEQRAATKRAMTAKARERGLPPGDPRHGTANGRSYWGCKCQDCRDAENTAARIRRLKKKAKALGVEIPKDLVRVRDVRSLDGLAEQRFGMDRIMVGSIWDDPVGDQVAEALSDA